MLCMTCVGVMSPLQMYWVFFVPHSCSHDVGTARASGSTITLTSLKNFCNTPTHSLKKIKEVGNPFFKFYVHFYKGLHVWQSFKQTTPSIFYVNRQEQSSRQFKECLEFFQSVYLYNYIFAYANISWNCDCLDKYCLGDRKQLEYI